MARPEPSCKAIGRAHSSHLKAKKAGGEAGGTSPPFDLPTEGGVFHRKVVKRANQQPAPKESAVGGGDYADGTLHLIAP